MRKQWHVHVALAAFAGAVLLSIVGCGGSDKPYVPDIRETGTWMLSWAPDSSSVITVQPGQSSGAGSFRVAVTTLSGVPRPVTLSAAFTGNQPTGWSLVAPDGPVTPTVSGTLATIRLQTTVENTSPGDYDAVITATDGTTTRTLHGVLRVAGYMVSVSPSASTTMFGIPATFAVTVTPLGTFAGTVNLSVADVNTGMFTTSFSSSSVTLSIETPETVNLTVTPSGDVGWGVPYHITVVGTCGGATVSDGLDITVVAPSSRR